MGDLKMSDDLFSEINTVMNYFALVDQCQHLGKTGYSLSFSMKAMPQIEKLIKEELQYSETRELFEKLENVFFPKRTEEGVKDV